MKSLLKMTMASVSLVGVLLSCGDDSTVVAPSVALSSSSSVQLPISSTTLSSSVLTSSFVLPSSSSELVGLSELIWAAGDGAMVGSGGYWYGFADTFGSSWGCKGAAYTDEVEVDVAPCDDGGMNMHFVIDAGIDGDANYGFAAMGFNLLDDGGAKSPPAYSDAESYDGLCVEYESDARIRLNLKTTADLNDDSFGIMLASGNKVAKVGWGKVTQEGWSNESWKFVAANLNQVHFQLKEADQSEATGHNVLIKKVYWFSGDCTAP